MTREQIEKISLDIHHDLLLMLRDGKIPDHEHWNDPETCGNLRWMIAAMIRKHDTNEADNPRCFCPDCGADLGNFYSNRIRMER